jgi:hypothetical protein
VPLRPKALGSGTFGTLGTLGTLVTVVPGVPWAPGGHFVHLGHFSPGIVRGTCVLYFGTTGQHVTYEPWPSLAETSDPPGPPTYPGPYSKG